MLHERGSTPPPLSPLCSSRPAGRAGRSARWPLALTLLILAGAAFATSSLYDAETLRPPGNAELQRSIAYVLLAPLCSIYDAVTVLSLRQHAAGIWLPVFVYVLWKGARHRRCRAGRWQFGGAAALPAALVGFYAFGLLLPRPMAHLALRDPDLVAVDFHSHTDASWDGRHGFNAAANRAWHRAAGFDAAYVSDHKTVAGARAAAAENPAHAGDGPILLEALEARDADEHIIALNLDTTVDVDPQGQWHDPRVSSALTHELRARLLILSIPGNVRHLPFLQQDEAAPIYAVELSDGSPKGIDQSQRDRAQILRLADSLGLAVVAGSDNHGWGRTAVAWSVLRIPGWRRMSAAELDSAIQHTIRTRGRHAVQVLVRRSPDPGASWMLLAASAVTIPWNTVRTLSWAERMSWVAWTWAVWGTVVVAATWLQRWDRGRRKTAYEHSW